MYVQNMYIHRYNQFSQRHYRYPLEDVDLTSPMFDENIHDNDFDFPKPHSSNICMYCLCHFESRNKLFHHLGFMNIDIGRDKRYHDNQRRHKRKFSITRRMRQYVPLKRRNFNEVASLTGLVAKKLKL